MGFSGIKNQVSGVGVVIALVFGALVIAAVMVVAQITTGGVGSVPAGDKVAINIKNTVFDMEIMRTQAERERGMMERTELCANCGMMFVFDAPGVYPFWMKNTPLSLDIVWLRHGRIVFVAQNTVPNSEERINPEVQADRVLEFNAGTTQRLGINIGDVVQW